LVLLLCKSSFDALAAADVWLRSPLWVKSNLGPN
jgi:hypothetical protein